MWGLNLNSRPRVPWSPQFWWPSTPFCFKNWPSMARPGILSTTQNFSLYKLANVKLSFTVHDSILTTLLLIYSQLPFNIFETFRTLNALRSLSLDVCQVSLLLCLEPMVPPYKTQPHINPVVTLWSGFGSHSSHLLKDLEKSCSYTFTLPTISPQHMHVVKSLPRFRVTSLASYSLKAAYTSSL